LLASDLDICSCTIGSFIHKLLGTHRRYRPARALFTAVIAAAAAAAAAAVAAVAAAVAAVAAGDYNCLTPDSAAALTPPAEDCPDGFAPAASAGAGLELQAPFLTWSAAHLLRRLGRGYTGGLYTAGMASAAAAGEYATWASVYAPECTGSFFSSVYNIASPFHDAPRQVEGCVLMWFNWLGGWVAGWLGFAHRSVQTLLSLELSPALAPD
jgi:hypothetical protein